MLAQTTWAKGAGGGGQPPSHSSRGTGWGLWLFPPPGEWRAPPRVGLKDAWDWAKGSFQTPEDVRGLWGTGRGSYLCRLPQNGGPLTAPSQSPVWSGLEATSYCHPVRPEQQLLRHHRGRHDFPITSCFLLAVRPRVGRPRRLAPLFSSLTHQVSPCCLRGIEVFMTSLSPPSCLASQTRGADQQST